MLERIPARVAVLAVCLSLAAGAVVRAGEPLPGSERVKIESLIAAVEKLDNAAFVRNGKAYPPATAARFLRGKWQDRSAEVRTAEDFVSKVASRSSTTGRPYMIRFDDGREMQVSKFLGSALSKLQ